VIARFVVGSGILLALFHLSYFVINPDILFADLIQVRQEVGVGYVPVAIATVLIIFRKRLGLGKIIPINIPIWLVMPLLLLSLALSYSRSLFIIVVVFVLSLQGSICKIGYRTFLTLFSVILILLTIVSFASSEDEISASILGKISHSIKEIAISDYKDKADINMNWRGFESYKALQSYYSGSVTDMIIGKGLGARVDLNFFMELQGIEYNSVPLLHNGYMYVLIKSGLVGLIFCIIFLFYIVKLGMRSSFANNIQKVFISRMLVGCGWSILISMFVIGGIYENATLLLLLFLIGYLSSYLSTYCSDGRKSAILTR
jgi:hypothetical protein